MDKLNGITLKMEKQNSSERRKKGRKEEKREKPNWLEGEEGVQVEFSAPFFVLVVVSRKIGIENAEIGKKGFRIGYNGADLGRVPHGDDGLQEAAEEPRLVFAVLQC